MPVAITRNFVFLMHILQPANWSLALRNVFVALCLPVRWDSTRKSRLNEESIIDKSIFFNSLFGFILHITYVRLASIVMCSKNTIRLLEFYIFFGICWAQPLCNWNSLWLPTCITLLVSPHPIFAQFNLDWNFLESSSGSVNKGFI